MGQTIGKLLQENRILKLQIEHFKQVNGFVTYIDDSALKGGYRIVESIEERDEIDCCHRKLGMVVSVKTLFGRDQEYINYKLMSNLCSNIGWVEVTTDGAVPGFSAYDLAVQEGFTGTLNEWLDSLVGDDGPIGPEGPPGPVGEISVITFDVNEDMHLIMQLETNTNLDIELDDNGHLILIN